MPEEGEKFHTVDATWRAVMATAAAAPAVLPLGRDPAILTKLDECNGLLDEIQKGLVTYLEKKRLFFPRFDFFSNTYFCFCLELDVLNGNCSVIISNEQHKKQLLKSVLAGWSSRFSGSFCSLSCSFGYQFVKRDDVFCAGFSSCPTMRCSRSCRRRRTRRACSRTSRSALRASTA